MVKQILLVEDSMTMQKVVEITFGHEDYRITSAKDADDALSRLRENRPDVVLADASLPGKSGYDLAAALKGDPAMREVPVLLLTSNFNPYDEARGQKAGVDAHVVKPFETQVLIDKVADLLRRKGVQPQPGSAAAQTLMQMPLMQVPSTAPVGAVAAAEGRRPTAPPQPPRVVTALGQAAASSPPQGVAPSMSSRPPVMTPTPVESGMQRSTLMGIPAVNPLGSAGLRPPPPPGMRVRETGNLPAINPPNLPAPSGSALPSWGRPGGQSASSTIPPHLGATLATTQIAPSTMAQAHGIMAPPAPVERPTMLGIPSSVPQMPRPSLIPRAPIPVTVLQALERIAQRGAEYEAIAKLSMEAIEQIVWEVVPELAEAMIRAEMDRLIKDRERQS